MGNYRKVPKSTETETKQSQKSGPRKANKETDRIREKKKKNEYPDGEKVWRSGLPWCRA